MPSTYQILYNACRDKNYSQSTAEIIADLLDRKPAEDYPQVQRCLMLSLLKSCILADANRSHPDRAENEAIPNVETLYPRSLRHIYNLQAADRYSKTLELWLLNGMRELVRDLKEDEHVRNSLSSWAQLSFPDKFILLQDIHNRHMRLYDPLLEPMHMRLMMKDKKNNILGRAFNGLNDSKILEGYVIELDPAIIENINPARALEVTHHETTHIIFGQLASAWADKKIDKNHILGDDAHLAWRRAAIQVYCPSDIRPAYDNDSEEKLATSEGLIFAARMGHPVGGRTKHAIDTILKAMANAPMPEK